MDIRNFWRRSADVSKREQEKTFQINFPFGAYGQSFSLSVTQSSFGAVYGHIININATGAQHPFDEDCMTGVIGDDNKNPGLLPVLQLLRTNLSVIAKAGMITAGLGARSMDKFEADRGGEPTIGNHSRGLWCLLRFNPNDLSFPAPNYKPATAKQVGILYDEVVKGLKVMEPTIKRLIHDNRHFQPALPIDSVDVLDHQVTLSTVRMRAMMAAGIATAAADEFDVEAMVKTAQHMGLKETHIARTDITGRVIGLVRATLQRRLG